MVSNREPYIHVLDNEKIKCIVPASGLTTALDPVMQACGGTWIAHGGGNADRKVVDRHQKVMVPPDDPKYQLRRVWLTKEEEEGYYYGFSNQALWPLCHIAYTRPIFNEAHWNAYRRVNKHFARQVLAEVGDHRAFVFVQDYHLALLPRLLRDDDHRICVAQFWHIPWPNPEAFRICPWQEEILDGLLGNDLLGFHIRYHCNNFMDTVDRAIEGRVDRERYEVTRGGRKTAIRPFPISVDFEHLNKEAQMPEVARTADKLKQELGITDEFIGLGLDRIDYTKGIPERLKAIDRFLDLYPEYRTRFVFIQAGVASREQISSYRSLGDEVDSLVASINFKYGAGPWKPVIFLRGNLPWLSLTALRRMAHFCVVSSLHDGMNLVAKEFVSNRYDEDGVLILSPFTGASRELTDALQVNPYATDHFAEAIRTAITMPLTQRQKRMRKMRKTVREHNIYKWAGDIVTELAKFEFGD
ncbi:MAG: trehalose-6-phosphate synthase [Chloroflexi bacterium]|nr:trehalose-6-phosphate synthase [Chloroflexota bacterium]